MSDYSPERLERALLDNEPIVRAPNPQIGSWASSPDRLDGELEERLADAANSLKYNNAFLDDQLRAILPTDLIVLGAPTGMGKTDLALNIATTNAFLGKRVHYFALEAEPRELERRTKFSMLSRALYEARHEERFKMNYTDWRLGKLEHICGDFNSSINARFARQLAPLWTLYRGNKFDTNDLRKQVTEVHDRTDLIVIDHLHYIDAREDQYEAKSLSDTVMAIREMNLTFGKPVILIAHLKKKEQGSKRLVPEIGDFHGSSNITKVCTQAITIERCHVVQAAKWFLSPTFFSVLKDRRDGASPFVAVANFDKRTKSYASTYTLGRLKKGGSDWEPVPIHDKPDWAINHRPLEEAA